MWYLVIPPIIVVVSLAFLLWYLSRKGTDPLIVEKMSENGGEQPSFSRTKAFFLGVIEKWAQRFKVVSLRAHNSLHQFTQSVKENRRKLEGSMLSSKKQVISNDASSLQEVSIPVASETKKSFFSRFKKTEKSEKSSVEQSVRVTPSPADESILEAPILRRRKSEEEGEKIAVTTEEAALRPMVSETVAVPENLEVRKKRTKPNVSREEALIERIAVNPKDFTAYEELGDYYLEIENIKDAKECYRQVLKLSPVHRMVKIKIRRLEKLLTREGE